MSNAAKHRKKAAEFEQLKQIDRAIASYVRAIEESESEGEDVDVALLNKVGDLALRQGRVPDAVTYYERAVEHYATAGLFNNAIALCNKILRNAPGRSNVYFTLGRICGKKGLRGDATRNFLEYAARMQQEGRVEEAMRALSEVAELMPELTEVSRLVEEHAARAGVQLPRRRTPLASEVIPDSDSPRYQSDKSSNLVFLEVDYGATNARRTPPYSTRSNTESADSAPLHPTPIAPSTAIPTPAVARSLPFIELTEADGAVDELAFEHDVMADLPDESAELGALDLIEFDTASLEHTEGNDEESSPLPLLDLEPIELPLIEWTDEPTSAIELELTAFDEDLASDVISLVEETSAESAHVSDAPELSETMPPAEWAARTDELDVASNVASDVASDVVSDVFGDLAMDVPTDVSAADESDSTADADSDDDFIASFAAGAVSDAHATPSSIPTPIASSTVDSVAESLGEGLGSSFETSADAPADVAEQADTASNFGASDVDVPAIDALDSDAATEHSRPAESSPVDVVAAAPTPASAMPEVPRRATPTPVRSASRTPSRTPLRSLEIPSIEAAIEAGAQLVARMAADATTQQRRPPYRLDPHDFILPGELPPLLVDDDLVNAGLDRAVEHELAEVAAADVAAAAHARAEAAIATPIATPVTTPVTTTPTPTPTPIAIASLRTPVAPGTAALTADVEFASDESSIVESSIVESTAVVRAPQELAFVGEAPVHDEAQLDVAADPASASELIEFGSATSIEAADGADEPESAPTSDARTAETDAEALPTPAHALAAVPATATESASSELVASDAIADNGGVASESESHADRTATPLHSSIIDAVDAPIETAPIAVRSAVRLTPALPIAAVAAEAKQVALSRRDELRAAVAAEPQDWGLRRRLAEALFEAGQRDAGLSEMEASLNGFAQGGQLETAADLSEELVRISPDRVAYHQKRVELAVRLKDQQRLRFAYLDLADTLVRSGEEGRAQAVYVRVLEIDPRDDRARAALGSAAPPLPTAVAAPVAEGFVNLADWLRDDDAPASTRMRMREPEVSGDEQADFDALLRHFKEGVSRSLGEEDYESRYDLGVAFKEMGLLDDAIAEFQKALRSKAHRLPAYEALGQCFVEQGRFQIAATVLSRALHEPGLNDEQRIGVLYLLAYSCEALQRWGEARSYFQRVYATDINFRDVAARMAALEQVAS